MVKAKLYPEQIPKLLIKGKVASYSPYACWEAGGRQKEVCRFLMMGC